MFSMKIVDSDAFMELSQTAQLLYFHLAMRADDDGFIGNPKRIMRAIGSCEDDMKLLLVKRFLLSFPNGIVVVKHWRIHNYIQTDRYNPTQYLEEKSSITVKENGSYTECIQNVDILDTQVRLGKDSIGKSKSKDTGDAEASREQPPAAKKPKREKKPAEFSTLGADLLKAFEGIDPKNATYYGNKTQRKACDFLIETYGFERVLKVVKEALPRTNPQPYFPNITDPNQLKEKWVKLEDAIARWREENNIKAQKENKPIFV